MPSSPPYRRHDYVTLVCGSKWCGKRLGFVMVNPAGQLIYADPQAGHAVDEHIARGDAVREASAHLRAASGTPDEAAMLARYRRARDAERRQWSSVERAVAAGSVVSGRAMRVAEVDPTRGAIGPRSGRLPLDLDDTYATAVCGCGRSVKRRIDKLTAAVTAALAGGRHHLAIG